MTGVRYYITDRRRTPDLLANVARVAAQRSADWIQVREKDLPARELLALVRSVVAIARPAGVRVLVSERADVAIAADADGVHLPSGGGPSYESLRGLGIRMIGVSCHNAEELLGARGADFAVLGPVFSPLSKSVATPAMGLTEFARLVTLAAGVPVLALGGITAENAPLCVDAGASGIAAITLFQG